MKIRPVGARFLVDGQTDRLDEADDNFFPNVLRAHRKWIFKKRGMICVL
jgi:hypothetical protein